MRKWEDYKKTMPGSEANLWAAAKADDLQTIGRLAADGADVNQVDHRGYSPLMLAVYSGQVRACRLLLAMGADPNSSDFAGNTILMGACFKGNRELVELLLERGADPYARNASGLSAFDFATTFGRGEVSEVLQLATGPQVAQSRCKTLFKIVMSRLR